MKLINSGIKRVFDFTAAFSGLLIFSPFLTVVIITIWLQDFKSPFYISDRVGKNEKLFKIVKLRSMVAGADKTGVDSTASNDARITVVGHFIRKYKLDELSQLWNVLKGDMSLVGPRPLVTEYLPLYSTEQARRHEVKPGITGWAQVNGRDELPIAVKVKFDEEYLARQSFIFDIKILWLTTIKVLKLEGISH